MMVASRPSDPTRHAALHEQHGQIPAFGAPVPAGTVRHLRKRHVGEIRLAYKKNSRGSSFTKPYSSVLTMR